MTRRNVAIDVPFHTVAVPVSDQWTRPPGSRSALPSRMKTFGAMNAPKHSPDQGSASQTSSVSV